MQERFDASLLLITKCASAWAVLLTVAFGSSGIADLCKIGRDVLLELVWEPKGENHPEEDLSRAPKSPIGIVTSMSTSAQRPWSHR